MDKRMVIRLYDFLHSHPRMRWTSLLCLTVVLVALVMRLSYKEDISDFLPLGTEEREAMNIYQDISGANQLFVIFENPNDEDKTVEAIDKFCENVSRRDNQHWTKGMTSQVDMDKIEEIQSFVYTNIPLFLTDADYARMDSLLADIDYPNRQMQADKEILMFPSGGILSSNIGRDPLNLFSPVVEKLAHRQKQSNFEMYEGYIFTPDMKKAIVMLSSPFGNAETEKNAQLMNILDESIKDMNTKYPDVKAHVIGGPQIAVGNANQIKTDSIIAVSLSVVLILLLLFFAFRSVKNICLIALSIGWGWLFALGGMSLMHDSVSVIVIGISSVILGIAVNYPLHLVAHVGHETNVRRAVKEIFAPLLVGNVTTVGAFFALVPLKSTALSDLGIFASLLLVGTIAFVLIYLPHHVKVQTKQKDLKILTKISSIQLESNRYIIIGVVLLTVVFGWFSLDTEFDSNMSHINYMTDQQHQDMDYFSKLMASDTMSTMKTLYIVSSGKTIDEALDKNLKRQKDIDKLMKQGAHGCEGVSPFLVSQNEQKRRIEKWNAFVTKHKDLFSTGIDKAAKSNGFTCDAFSDFKNIISARYTAHPFEYFSPLTTQVFAGNISIAKEGGRYSIVDKVSVDGDKLSEMEKEIPQSFDVESMNSAMANSLSNDFNYIGWACSLIVFFFLWFSFGRIELAILSFLPMAISWVWILGIMTLLGVKFNIVNVILATFIFGQGDDYTIFMTEGCQYEYTYRRPMLASYKNSIILSALIMFIGIGTLIVAKHPALLSLAEVTIIGMFSVVLMAWLIPPFIFNWLTRSNGKYRLRPLTLLGMFYGDFKGDIIEEKGGAKSFASLVRARYIYKGMEIERSVKRSLRESDCFSASVDRLYDGDEIIVENKGYGEEALLMALVHPDKKIIVVEEDADKQCIIRNSADGLVENLVVICNQPNNQTTKQPNH